MVTLTSEFESDSFLGEMSINDEDENKTPVENFRRTLDLHDAQFNQITTNNRE
ncbi:unnamed protein product, partial [Adineta ricciae]